MVVVSKHLVWSTRIDLSICTRSFMAMVSSNPLAKILCTRLLAKSSELSSADQILSDLRALVAPSDGTDLVFARGIA